MSPLYKALQAEQMATGGHEYQAPLAGHAQSHFAESDFVLDLKVT